MLRWFESITRHVTTQTQISEEIVTDRSPELARGAGPIAMTQHWTHVSVPSPDECVRGDGAKCILAEALKRILGPGWEPHIEGERPYVTGPDGARRDLNLDPVIVDAIGRFDRGDPDAFKDVNITIYWD